jgi:hypothetical protein
MRNKFLILGLVIVFAFGALGVGYAHWQQTLYVEGTVNTGKLCWGIVGAPPTPGGVSSLVSLYDNDFPPTPGTSYVVPPPWSIGDERDPTTGVGFVGGITKTTKNVAWITLELKDDKGCDHLGVPLYATANVTFHNVYPCYFAEIHIVVANGGTIPVIIEAVKIDGNTVTVSEHWWNQWMEFKWLDGPPEIIQIDPCGTHEMSFKFHILEAGDDPDGTGPGGPVTGAQEGATYNFLIELVGVQWNLANP